MKITRRLYNLTKGTYLEDTAGIIVLTSDYDECHGWYEYHDVEIDEDGGLVELETGGYVAPSDLIGYEII